MYVVACIVTCTVGFLADRYGNRGLFNLYVLEHFHSIVLFMVASGTVASSPSVSNQSMPGHTRVKDMRILYVQLQWVILF